MKAVATLLVLCVILPIVLGDNVNAALGIGDRLVRGYRKYDSLPLNTSSATRMGWSAVNPTCIGGLGIAYTSDRGGPTESHPITLYYTKFGQIAGMGMRIYGEPKVPANYLISISPNVFQIDLSFRNTTWTCSNDFSPLPLGDQLVINQAHPSISQAIPLATSEMTGNWTKGACFETMGTHWFYDVSTRGPRMSWQAANLLPIVPMYHQGRINAIFFSSTSVQQGLLSPNMWDGIPLINKLMCMNWCDSACTFADTWKWSTCHIYFNDYTQVTCPGGCTVGCCPGLTRSTEEQEMIRAAMDMPHMDMP